MERLIKLIWDFHGVDSHEIALHHEKHLIEYLHSIKYNICITKVVTLDEFSNLVYIVIDEVDLIKFRDVLKPKRAELYEN